MADGYISQITLPNNNTYLLKDSEKISAINASGTAPLTLSSTKSGTTYTLTGSVADASFTTSGIVNTSAQVFGGGKTLRFTSRIYPLIGTSAERSQWYKITFPYSTITTGSSAQWFMNSFDLHFGGGYSANPSGVAHVTFYWTRAANNGAWAVGQQAALIEGILANKIGLYYRIAEPGVLYVNNTANTYNGIWIDNLYVDDTAINLNWSTITITATTAITESTSPKLSDYTKITTSYLYNDGGTLKTDSNFEGKYIKGTWLYTSAATAKTSTSKLATIESDNFIYYITPANALKSAIGTTAIGAAKTPIYWDGSKFTGGTALKNLAYKDSLTASDIPDLSGTYVKKVTSTDNAIVRFDGTGGQIQNSGTIIDDNNNISVSSILSNLYSGYNLCKLQTSASGTEIVIKTKFKFVNSATMPSIRIHGYSYGKGAPLDLTIVYYIYSNEFYVPKVISTGGVSPDIYLFTYTENSIKYVAIGIKSSLGYLGFTVDANGGALGGLNINPDSTLCTTGWTIEHNGSNTSNTLIPAVNTDNCKLVPYLALSTTVEKAISANLTSTTNAVAYYTDAAGKFGSKASANGALYATSANGALQWGTLPIAQGGTGKTNAADAWTALGGGASGKHADSYFALASHNHAASNITSGTFDVARIPNLSWSKITSDKPTTLSGYGITNAVQYNGIDNDIGSSAAAANAKAYWANNNKVPKGKVVFNYNSSGTEFTTLFSNNNNSYGSILRWGYQDNYIRILRAHPNQTTYNGWYTEDWEKISAGYADTAPWSGISNKPTKITLTGAVTGNVSLNSGELSLATTVNHNHDSDYVNVTGDTMTGDLVLSNTGSGDSPALRFARNSTNTDWRIKVSSGQLQFASAINDSSYTTRAYFKDQSGDLVLNSIQFGNNTSNYINNTFYTGKSRFSYHASAAHASINTGGSGWLKVKIKKKASWMLTFTIRLYTSYAYYDYAISGYNYGSDHWYSATAVLLGSNNTNNRTVKFGYDDDAENGYCTLWVAVQAGNYYGIDIFNVTNGHSQYISDIENMFEIIHEDELTGTQQGNDQIIYGPWRRNETVSNATTAGNISGILALANLTKGDANTALMGKGSSTAPAYVSVSPSISITAGTADNAPKVNLTVLGVSGTAQELTKATTGVYGATKLSSAVNSSSEVLAATPKAVKMAYDQATTALNTANNLLATADAMVFKGTLGTGGTITAVPTGASGKEYQAGYTYKIITDGTYAGNVCEVGDLLIAIADSTSGQTTVNNAHWTVVQSNLERYIHYYNNHDNNINSLIATPYLQTAAANGGSWNGSPTMPTGSHNGLAVFNFQTHSGNYYTQLALDTNQNRLWLRSANNATAFGAWSKIATVADIEALDVSNISGFGTTKTLKTLTQTDGKIAATFQDIAFPVTSVAGKTGAVTLAKGDVGLGNVDNTADANKSVNYATSAGSATTATWVGKGTHTAAITANEFTPAVGTMTVLGNVSNTSMSHSNNANAEIIIKAHPTSGTSYFEARLGFSSNGSIYHMPVNTTNWERILTETNTYAGDNATASMTWGGTYTLARINGTDIKVTMPGNPNTNTTYTFAEGSTNGAFSVTPSGGSAQSVPIHGLGTAAYKAVGDFAAASHSHSYLANTNAGAADRPIYITGNAAAQTTYRMAGTNVTATAALAITNNLDTGIWYVNGTSGILSQNDGAAYVNKYSDSWLHEIYGDYRTGHIAVRGKNNGTWKDWLTVLDSGNYTDYTVTKTGSGASGSWGISVTGSAGSVAWGNVGSRPTSIKLTGAVTGSVTIGAGENSIATTVNHTHNYAGSSSAGGAATTVVTTEDTTNELILTGVVSNATTTLKRDTYVTAKSGQITIGKGIAIDNTTFNNRLIIYSNQSNEHATATFDATKSSWGIGFQRKWNNGTEGGISAGIYAFGVNSWRTGLVFRVKTGTVAANAHDLSALILHDDGSATFDNDVRALSYIINNKVQLQWNNTDSSLDFVFA